MMEYGVFSSPFFTVFEPERKRIRTHFKEFKKKEKVFVSEHIVFLLKTLYLLSVKLNCQNEVKNRTEYRVE